MVSFTKTAVKNPRKAIVLPSKHLTDVLKYALNNENVARQIEEFNTLVFICDNASTKPLIKKAFEDLYATKVRKVNTLVTPKGKKKAYIKLREEGEAANIASKIGII